jgi:hypothetical protein
MRWHLTLPCEHKTPTSLMKIELKIGGGGGLTRDRESLNIAQIRAREK